MEHFIQRLDTLLDNDPFVDLDRSSLTQNDLELIEKYRAKYLAERKRIREERKSKNFQEIMEDLLQTLADKPDISLFYRTLDDPLLATNSTHRDVHTIELDTSDDEQDDLEHCTAWIDPSKSIGRSVINDELKTSTYAVYPLTKSSPTPTLPPPPPPITTVTMRKVQRYADEPRRNTYTLQSSSSSSSSSDSENDHAKNTEILTKGGRECMRLDSQGFDPSDVQENLFTNAKDARSTFLVPQKRFRLSHQEAQSILQKKLGAFIKGHLTRQLFRTEHVKRLIRTLNDTQKFAVEFQTQRLQMKTDLDLEDINIIDQLIKQAESVLDELHAIFTQYPPARQIMMIFRNEQAQKMRTKRANERIAKDCAIERPIIDPIPASNVKTDTAPSQTEYRRPQNIRRHVTAVPNRSNQSTTNIQGRPLKKAVSLQRKSRLLNSNTNSSSTSARPRSSSTTTTTTNNTNNNVFRPPLRLVPASPLFRNRLK